MNDPLALHEADMKAIVRLLGEVISAEGDHGSKKCLLMEGLCRLIDADSWYWGLGYHEDSAKNPAYVGMYHGGFTDETYAAINQAAAHPAMTSIQARFAKESATRNQHLTRHRRQLDPDDSYEKTTAFPLWRKANINGVILSFKPMAKHSFSCIGIYRRASAPLFSDRENRIAHIVLSGLPWLHAQGWPENQGDIPKLSPRQRVTLTLLLQGFSRARIAEHLEISTHTANEYVKAVFNHFGVHSQAALIAWWRTGDGGDQ